jgi:hypothetical protein
MLQGQLPTAGLSDIAAVPLPPIPEEVESVEFVERLATLRDDDLLYAGEVDSSRIDQLVSANTQVAERYLAMCQEVAPVLEGGATALDGSSADAELDAEVVVWEFLSNRERLGELTKMIGMTRYAVSGDDGPAVERLKVRMERLGAMLPGSFRIERVIAAAARPGSSGDRLSELYIERCYKLLDEDYRALESVDVQILELEQA